MNCGFDEGGDPLSPCGTSCFMLFRGRFYVAPSINRPHAVSPEGKEFAPRRNPEQREQGKRYDSKVPPRSTLYQWPAVACICQQADRKLRPSEPLSIAHLRLSVTSSGPSTAARIVAVRRIEDIPHLWFYAVLSVGLTGMSTTSGISSLQTTPEGSKDRWASPLSSPTKPCSINRVPNPWRAGI
jgi:hypothetical protein